MTPWERKGRSWTRKQRKHEEFSFSVDISSGYNRHVKPPLTANKRKATSLFSRPAYLIASRGTKASLLEVTSRDGNQLMVYMSRKSMHLLETETFRKRPTTADRDSPGQ